MCLYLSLSALHVSDSLVHHQKRRFGAVYRNWYKPVPYIRVAVVRCTRASSWSTYIHTAIRCTVHTTSHRGTLTSMASLIFFRELEKYSSPFWRFGCKFMSPLSLHGARGSAVGLGTAIRAGRSRGRVRMLPLEYFIDVNLPAALWTWGSLSL